MSHYLTAEKPSILPHSKIAGRPEQLVYWYGGASVLVWRFDPWPRYHLRLFQFTFAGPGYNGIGAGYGDRIQMCASGGDGASAVCFDWARCVVDQVRRGAESVPQLDVCITAAVFINEAKRIKTGLRNVSTEFGRRSAAAATIEFTKFKARIISDAHNNRARGSRRGIAEKVG